MKIKKGIAVCQGIAIGEAVVVDAEDYRVPRRTVPQHMVHQQHERVTHALHQARNELEEIRQRVERELGSEPAKIFGFHLGMLWDDSLINQFHQAIDSDAVTAEYAVYSVMRNVARTFLQQSDPLFRERTQDIWDLEKRMLGHLLIDTWTEAAELDRDAVIIAHSLTPSQTASLPYDKVLGMGLDIGGRTSHTAIVAKAQNVPCVLGLEDATVEVQTGDVVIIDGNRGLLIIDPDQEKIEAYKREMTRMQSLENALRTLVDLPAVTQDGEKIDLLANIEFPEEIPKALSNGALGVGLYRTEFLYLGRTNFPDEEEQYETYTRALKLMQGQTMTLRTVDLGADKMPSDDLMEMERNPVLGCRSIRLCLLDIEMFRTQIRAALRASVHGKLKLMFPLVTSMSELRQARMLVNDVMEDLEEAGIAFDTDIPIGMMIEVPSVALMARTFADEVDFFSIGTNDLIQYTLAVDRTNERVANMYTPAHPAVLKLMRDIIRASKRGGVDVTCCGEMAGELEYIMLLLGMGLRRFSMTPKSLPEIKKLVRSVSITHCQKVARRAASYDSEKQVLNYLREETRRVMPEIYQD